MADRSTSLLSLSPDRFEVFRRAAREASALLDAPTSDEAEDILEGYFHDVQTEDLQAESPRVLLGSALAHRRAAARRHVGETVVRVHDPDDSSHGWSTSRVVVHIVTDDMPFLVDTVLAELNRHGAAVRLLVHPQPSVLRDGAGELVEIIRGTGGAPDAGEHQAIREAWIQVQVDGLDADDLDDLASDLTRVLSDVRVAVEDWGGMQDRARGISASLRQSPPVGIDTGQVELTTRLLDWLVDGHFVFLGYREYDFLPDESEGSARLAARAGTGLGFLRDSDDGPRDQSLPPAVARKAGEHRLLIVTKANSVSTVHRPRHLDYIGVKTFDDHGRVTGEHRFLGLFTSEAASLPVTEVPVLSHVVAQVFERTGLSRKSHLGKDLLDVLKTYPRSELFEADIDHISDVALAAVHLNVRPRTRFFLRRDDYERFTSCLVFVPREVYSPEVKTRIETILSDALDGDEVSSEESVSQSPLAQLHVVVRVAPGGRAPQPDAAGLERRVVTAARSWSERLADTAGEVLGDGGPELARRFTFPSGYHADFTFREAVEDLRQLSHLVDSPDGRRTPASQGAAVTPDAETDDVRLAIRLYTSGNAPEQDSDHRQPLPEGTRLKLYRYGDLPLSAVLPIFASLGLEVVDERPYALGERNGRRLYLYDFGLRSSDVDAWYLPEAGDREAGETSPEGRTGDDLPRRLEEAFLATWRGVTETDGLGALVLLAGLTWRQVEILRALTSYLRQAGSIYSREYVEAALIEHPDMARDLVELFEARFDPDRGVDDTGAERDRAQAAIALRLSTALDAVVSLNTDRILRALVAIVRATVRTSFYCGPGPIDDDSVTGDHRPTIALKLQPGRLAFLPEPRPWAEIWVYGTDVEGVHLRYGPVARGGLRWSDRPGDFRTEVLGLVKAQAVKNAIIVPVGAKGGFVAKRLPDPSHRDAWYRAGTQAYRLFISSLLDVTDNLDISGAPGTGEQRAVTPARVVCHDDDDPYLVVAADKGTAAFSDVANAVAADYGFWLDDAFASGGSNGYDHKVMGITARGAWEAVKRHFREMDHDIQTENFTVVGIGDMSGDVFGNGMLLSEHISLVSAFNHQHIFLDPDPDIAASFAERKRLFEAGRTTWDDYDTSVISSGGGVWPRSVKAVPVAESVRTSLGLDADVTELTPPELIRAIITAEIDLVWNGGIGTYVKARSETHDEIGDRANDTVRVNGDELRCRVVGEGGNLGLSQLGRVEAALNGVRVNTDAIDNSAGVDSSDHEVNLKILLASAVAAGELDREERDRILASLTDEVADRVLRQNYEQSVLLGNARTVFQQMAGAHIRLMHWLEENGDLDRELEFLPSDAELAERGEYGRGLTSPEFSVFAAYAKLTIKSALLESDLPDEDWFSCELEGYFPESLRERFGEHISGHRLRREIIATRVANSVVNRGGTTFVYRAMEETAAPLVEIVRAFIVAREVFGITEFVEAVERLDNEVSAATQAELYLEFRRLLDRAVRWLVLDRPEGIRVATEIERFAGLVAELRGLWPDHLLGTARESVERRSRELAAQGVPDELADLAAGLVREFTTLDVVAIAEAHRADPAEVSRIRAAVENAFLIDRLHDGVEVLPREERWEALARFALRDDLYAVHSQLTASVLAEVAAGPSSNGDGAALRTEGGPDATELVDAWTALRPTAVGRSQDTLAAVTELDEPGLAALQVAVRTLRSACRT